MRSFLAAPLTMASPFVGVPVDLGARIVQESLQQRVFQDRSDPLALPENIQVLIRGYSLFDCPC